MTKHALGKGSDWGKLLTDIDWPHVAERLGLSFRELQVVQHILEGKSLAAVAEELSLALGTVKTYSGRIYAKLGIKSQCQLGLAVLCTALTSDADHAATDRSRSQRL